jgi:hypothetical protein
VSPLRAVARRAEAPSAAERRAEAEQCPNLKRRCRAATRNRGPSPAASRWLPAAAQEAQPAPRAEEAARLPSHSVAKAWHKSTPLLNDCSAERGIGACHGGRSLAGRSTAHWAVLDGPWRALPGGAAAPLWFRRARLGLPARRRRRLPPPGRAAMLDFFAERDNLPLPITDTPIWGPDSTAVMGELCNPFPAQSLPAAGPEPVCEPELPGRRNYLRWMPVECWTGCGWKASELAATTAMPPFRPVDPPRASSRRREGGSAHHWHSGRGRSARQGPEERPGPPRSSGSPPPWTADAKERPPWRRRTGTRPTTATRGRVPRLQEAHQTRKD